MKSLENCHIDEIVFLYQEGDELAGEEILRRYGCHPNDKELTKYVGKYFKMLRRGVFNFKDKDSRAFIRCFVADKELRDKLIPFYQYKETIERTYEVLNRIIKQLKAIDDEDMKQDLRMLLLIQAQRYEKTKKSVDFNGYLYNSYRFAVKNWIQKLTKPSEPYMHMHDELLGFAEDSFADEDSEIEVNEDLFAAPPMIEMDEEIGNSWVRGITCGEEFKDLTPLQRLIIKLHYHDGLTDGKIAEMMGIHINTIFRQRKKAGQIIEQTTEELIQKGYYDGR